MLVHHQRIQHPVGQGFFHSAVIQRAADAFPDLVHSQGSRLVLLQLPAADMKVDPYRSTDPDPFRYVYDCGSVHGTACDAEVDAYLGTTREIDILFVSHVHNDHVSGLSRLLHDPAAKPRRAGVPLGLVAKTIVLPLLEPEARLAAFVSSWLVDPTAASDPFYVDFIADPIGTLSERGTQVIVLVRPSGEGGAPGRGPGGIVDGIRPEPEEDVGFDDSEPGQRWGFVGDTASIEPRDTVGNTRVLEIPHTCGLATRVQIGDTKSRSWLFNTFVDPSVEAGLQAFFDVLEAAGFAKARLSDPQVLRDLLTNHLTTLYAAYLAAGKLNHSSLCLYSGTAKEPSPVWVLQDDMEVLAISGPPRPYRLAWLGTGDAKLTGTHFVPFEDHYRALLSKVATLTVPHHGSTGYSDGDLYAAVSPRRCVAAAAEHLPTWLHPGTDIVRHIGDHGIPLTIVTKSGKSKLTEDFLFSL